MIGYTPKNEMDITKILQLLGSDEPFCKNCSIPVLSRLGEVAYDQLWEILEYLEDNEVISIYDRDKVDEWVGQDYY